MRCTPSRDAGSSSRPSSAPPPEPADHPEDARELSEEDVISLLKDTFDAEEVEEH